MDNCLTCEVPFETKVVAGRPKVYCSRKCKELAWGRSGQQRLAHKRWWLRKKYGITLERYEELRQSQGGGCAICGRTEPIGRASAVVDDVWLHVDHNHETGQVRGLLCTNCNHSLGGFGDDPAILRRAAAYLEAQELIDYTP